MVGQFSVCMQRFVGFYNLLEEHFSHLFSSYHYMFRPIWPSSGVSIRVSAPSAMQWSASASGFCVDFLWFSMLVSCVRGCVVLLFGHQMDIISLNTIMQNMR
jgi:hypothetical protein